MASKHEPDGDRKTSDTGPGCGSIPGRSDDPSSKPNPRPESTRRHDHMNSDGVKQCLQPEIVHQQGHSSKPGPGPAGGAGPDELEAEQQKQVKEFSKSTWEGGRVRPSDTTGQTSTGGDEDELEAESRRQAEESFWKKEIEGGGQSRPGSPMDTSRSQTRRPSQSDQPEGAASAGCRADRPERTSAGGSRHQSETGGSDWTPGGGAGPHGQAENIKPSKSSAESHKPPPKQPSEATCCRLDELRRLPDCRAENKPLHVGPGHTVLVDVNAFNFSKSLRPHVGVDIWGSNCVKMPNSPQSIMIYESSFPKTSKRVKRWDVIQKTLAGLAKKSMLTVKSLEEAIMKYNPKYKGQWSFSALSSLVGVVPPAENYFQSLFPKMADLALKLPSYVRKPIPLLLTGHPAAITLSQMQIACLLANAFFCTFPHRNTTASNAEYQRYPSINFSTLFGNTSPRMKEKLRAIMHYFKQVTDDSTRPQGLVTFERRVLADTSSSNWRRCKETMPKLHVTSHGTIETEGEGMLQVDFASSWIGGGVLSAGLVQEEILFLINPELIVSRLFTEKLADNECLIITGVQQFSRYTGFSDGFEWAGNHDDHVSRDHWARKQRQILAIDALHYKQRRNQYNMRAVTRELNKAFCGFKGSENEPDIATGKWGCGAFNGDAQLKAVIQLMAAARARRGLAFFTFEDENLREGLQQLHKLLMTEKTSVGKLFELLEDYCTFIQGSTHVSLFDFLYSKVMRSPL